MLLLPGRLLEQGHPRRLACGRCALLPALLLLLLRRIRGGSINRGRIRCSRGCEGAQVAAGQQGVGGLGRPGGGLVGLQQDWLGRRLWLQGRCMRCEGGAAY
jgi:hypothetical protein